MVSACFPAPCTCSAESKAWSCSPSQCVWVWLRCCWVPGRRKGWITAGCPFAHRVSWALQTTLTLPLEFWVWGQPVRLVLMAHIGGECLALQLEKAPWHCCSLECNVWLRVAEPSGDAPIPLLHKWNTLPALLFNSVFGSQWCIWIHSPSKLLHWCSDTLSLPYYVFFALLNPNLYGFLLTFQNDVKEGYDQDAINI